MNIPTHITASLSLLIFFASVPIYSAASLDEIRLKAERGDAAAQVQLGDAYDTGAGVKKDVAEAIKWYRKAAEQGNADAQFGLGASYYAGAGVLKDETEALAWFMLSAAAGNNEAAKQRDALERALDTKKKQLAQERSKKIAQEIEARRNTSPTEEKTKDAHK